MGKDIVPGMEILYNKDRFSAVNVFPAEGEDRMNSKETFFMKPKVDFCFKELMEDAEIRRGFLSALLGVEPEQIERTELLPTHLRRERLASLSADEEKRLEYEAREKAIRDHQYLMNTNLKLGLKRGEKKGLEKGAGALVELCQESSFSREETLARLMQKLSLSSETAKGYLEKYWKCEN